MTIPSERRWVRLMMRPREEGSFFRASAPWVAGLAVVMSAVVVIKLPLVLVAFPALVLGTWSIALALSRPARAAPSSSDVTCDADGVRRRGQLLAPRDQIKQGIVVPIDGGEAGHCIVELKRTGLRPSLHLIAWNVREAREALRALGLDASRSVAEVWGASRWFAMLPWVRSAICFTAFMCLSLVALQFDQPLGRTVLALVFLFPILRSVPARIRVGADGIYYRWMGFSKFYAFSDVAGVRCYQLPEMGAPTSGVELQLTSGARIQLPVSRQAWAQGDAPKLYERVEEAFEAFRRDGKAPELSCLERGRRTHADWVCALRSVGSGAHVDMRTPPLPPDRLLCVVEDTSATPLARTAAAVAIARVLPPSERRRIRVAAEASAAPMLRFALERSSDPRCTDEDLAELLSDLEATAATARAT